MIPKDPVMLLSFINLKLRDYYRDLSLLCEDLDISEDMVKEKLGSIQYYYDSHTNQFR